MMRSILKGGIAVGSMFVLTACQPSVSTSSHQRNLGNTPGFENCRAIESDDGRGDIITVVRCPNSTTTTSKRMVNLFKPMSS